MAVNKCYKPVNFYSSTLNGAIDNAVLAIVVNTPPSFTKGYAILDYADSSKREITEITNVVGSTLTVVRGVDGTTGQAHANGATIVCVPNAAYLADLVDTVLVDHNASGQHKQLTDTNGNKILALNPVGTAVNQIQVSNAAANGTPDLAVVGSDTNIDMTLTPKGTGAVRIGSSAISNFAGVLGAPGTATSNQASITTETDLTGLTTTVAVPAGGRRVKITAFVAVFGPTATGVDCFIKEGSTYLAKASINLGNTGTNNQLFCLPIAIVTPTAGSHTYKVSLVSSVGGAITAAASATAPNLIVAEAI